MVGACHQRRFSVPPWPRALDDPAEVAVEAAVVADGDPAAAVVGAAVAAGVVPPLEALDAVDAAAVVGVDSDELPHAARRAAVIGADNPSAAARVNTWRRVVVPTGPRQTDGERSDLP